LSPSRHPHSSSAGSDAPVEKFGHTEGAQPRLLRQAITANFEAPDKMLKAEAKLPMEPIEKAEPTDPIDMNDPYDPIDRQESREYALSMD